MKKFTFCLLLLNFISIQAQDFKGIAIYESKTNAEMTISGDNETPAEFSKELEEQLKKALEKTFELHFDKTASIYEEQQKLEEPSVGMGGIQINIHGGGKHYQNLKEKKSLLETEVFGKEFLVSDSLRKWEWKLGSETKKIGAYTCYKATAVYKVEEPFLLPEEEKEEKAVDILNQQPKERTVTAWYAPDIPVGHGPGDYWGLPGLILEVNNDKTTILCSKLILNPKEKIEIKAPKKGEKITKAKFDEIVEKKTKEMMEMHDRPGEKSTVIRIGG